MKRPFGTKFLCPFFIIFFPLYYVYSQTCAEFYICVCVLFVRLNFVVSYFNINTRQLTENLLFFLVQMSKSVYKVSSEREFIVDVFQLSAVFFSLFFLYMLLSMLSP